MGQVCSNSSGFEMFLDNCKKMYTIGELATVDEMLEAFRGRCYFKQYMPKEPNKYISKICSLVDAKTWYVLNVE